MIGKRFLPVCNSSFYSLTLSFKQQKFLTLMKSRFPVFSLMAQGHTYLLLCFLPHIILYFTFRSIIHCEFIFVHGVGYGSKDVFVKYGHSVVSAPCVDKTIVLTSLN